MLEPRSVSPFIRSANVTDLESNRRRYLRLVAENKTGASIGWASLNPYTHRCAYRGVADLSIFVARDARGTSVGSALLAALERYAKGCDFHKIVLSALVLNPHGQTL